MSSGSQLSILPHPEPTPELPQRAEGQIIVGDTLEELKKFPEETFQCCVTSPPYWGLRDYGIPGQILSDHPKAASDYHLKTGQRE